MSEINQNNNSDQIYDKIIGNRILFLIVSALLLSILYVDNIYTHIEYWGAKSPSPGSYMVKNDGVEVLSLTLFMPCLILVFFGTRKIEVSFGTYILMGVTSLLAVVLGTYDDPPYTTQINISALVLFSAYSYATIGGLSIYKHILSASIVLTMISILMYEGMLPEYGGNYILSAILMTFIVSTITYITHKSGDKYISYNAAIISIVLVVLYSSMNIQVKNNEIDKISVVGRYFEYVYAYEGITKLAITVNNKCIYRRLIDFRDLTLDKYRYGGYRFSDDYPNLYALSLYYSKDSVTDKDPGVEWVEYQLRGMLDISSVCNAS